nr:hypothetical protein [Lachnospiraceae bacterium]
MEKRQKRVNVNTEYIRSLLKGGRPDDGRSAVIYVGNGASESNYAVLTESGEIDGEAYEHLGGFFDLCALQYVNTDAPVIVHNEFLHNCAVFDGFTARRKNKLNWEWYCADGQWHGASEEAMEKRVFLQGEELDLIKAEDNMTLILDARWKAENGDLLGCGYAMYTNELMAHAFGGMNGKTYHNTMAAFENGIEKGYKYFEVDLSYTTDRRLVLCHGWTAANCKHTGFKYNRTFKFMPYARLMQMKVHGNKMISARNFYKKIRDLDEYTYEIDFHNVEGEEMEKRMRALEKDFRYDQKVLDRLLIQVYSKKMYESIGDTSYFKNYQYLVGKSIHDLDDIITYSLDHGICALAVRFNLAKPEYIRKIRNAGLYVMCYTVNHDLVISRTLLENGVNTLCTDYITKEDLDGQKDGFAHYPFRISYSSGNAKAESCYEGLTEGEELERSKSGILTWRDPQEWKNDGKRKLHKCRFALEGKRFAGWKMKVLADGKYFWYCKDRLYHAKGDIAEGTLVEPYIFSDEEQIPVWNLEQNTEFIMVAVWEEE